MHLAIKRKWNVRYPTLSPERCDEQLCEIHTKRVRKEPKRFDTMIAQSRGGTMRERTLCERLLQISFYRGEGVELFGDCKQIFMPLFDENAEVMTDILDEDAVSLLLSRAHLYSRLSHNGPAKEIRVLEQKLKECIREQYQDLVVEELQHQHACILRDETPLDMRIASKPEDVVLSCVTVPDVPITSTDDAKHSFYASIASEPSKMMNANLHLSILKRLVAEEIVANTRRQFMCPLSRSLMLCPVTTSNGTVYDRKRC
jgi:hypothetical protein